VITPRGHAAFRLGLLSKDEPQKDVEAADGKKEKSRDERKVVDVMREGGRTESYVA